jgi:hypothetical protein
MGNTSAYGPCRWIFNGGHGDYGVWLPFRIEGIYFISKLLIKFFTAFMSLYFFMVNECMISHLRDF